MRKYLLPIIGVLLLGLSCEKKEQEVPVASVSMSQATAEMVVGETISLIATVLPSSATDKTVNWASSNRSVATVAGGKVTAVSEGQSTITASAGGKSATCTVTVRKKTIDVASVELNKTELALTEGDSETLVATVKPDDATDKTVTWTTSNSNVVSVDNGKVTAVGGGSATIKAKAGEVEATCNVTVTVPVSSVTLDKNTLSLVEGEEATLNATVRPDDATDKAVIWTSSNSTIATVEKGKVKALKEGEAIITASAGGKSATCAVTVSKKVIPVTSVELNKSTLTLVKGTTEGLSATVKPDDATDKTVTWSSSNQSIATVDSDGRVTGVAGGEVTIYAKAGEVEAKCIVTVTIPVTSVSLNKETITLVEGEFETLVATIEPSDATNKTLSWSTSNAMIATVDSEGKVTAVKKGETTVTVKAGEKSAVCLVKVNAPYIPISGVSLNKSSLELKKGSSETLVASVSPSDATEPFVTWSTSNGAIVSVDQNGKVTALNTGTATITAKAGDYSAVCSVSVTIPAIGVTLNRTSLTLAKGNMFSLVATVYPEDATNKNVTWSSANTGIATVTDGTVIAVGGGVTEISVRTQDGGFEAKCTVTVNVSVNSVSLSSASLDIYQYDEVALSATVYPSDATNKAVTWSSNHPSVASVDSNGKITGVSGGSATITVKTVDGGYTSQCYVTVTADAHQAIDLGLSVKWATMNFGATSSTQKGGYYMWGDPTGIATAADFSAPNVSSISGTAYDIARKNWGGSWRIPTRSELGELYTKCIWKQETVNGVSVFRVTGPNGNSIIVPFTGLGYPASGPAGTKQYISTDKAYLMSGTSYSDQYGRFVYVYYYGQNGKYNWESYNADFVYITIRPVR